MIKFTPTEATAINAAWQAVKQLCECTNWSDSGTWREAEKLERQQAPADEPRATTATWARAMICKQWLEGLESPDTSARDLYGIRPGCLAAFMLGVRHAIERAGTDYNGPMVTEAAELCRAAVAANEAHTRRIVEG